MTARRIALLVALALVWGGPIDAGAQDTRAGKVARIGRLSALSAEADARNLEAFRKGLHALGWLEGRSFTIEARHADGVPSRLPALAMQLVQQRVDVIVAGSSPGALAAMKATPTIPIVSVTTGDPVADGLVTSLARPGGNVTGVTALSQALNAKRLELLRDTLPGVRRVGLLIQPDSASTPAFLKEKDAAARALGLELRLLEAKDPSALEKALALGAAERVEALLVQTTALFITQRRRIVELVARHRLPAIYGERGFIDAGGFMFYGASLADMYRDAAGYVDRILKGARPADLPVEQPTRLELVINLKTAKDLGLTIPASVLARADHVIQ